MSSLLHFGQRILAGLPQSGAEHTWFSIMMVALPPRLRGGGGAVALHTVRLGLGLGLQRAFLCRYSGQ